MSSDWTEISIEISSADVETASNIANLCVPYGIYIEDYSNLELESMEISNDTMIDEKLLAKDREKAIIHIYISNDENPNEAISFIKERFDSENIKFNISTSSCIQENWINNWKQYFHPIEVGKNLLVRPLWIDEYNSKDRKVISIDPGVSFGSGTHATTKLCLETLEDYVSGSTTVLDVGCGSGILAIASLLFGGKSATGVDIDKTAVKTAIENGNANGFTEPQLTILEGNLVDKVFGKFDVVVANIVADVIIMFSKDVGNFMNDHAVFITSGIIDSREEDVQLALAENGFHVVRRVEENGWLVLVSKKAK